MLKARETSFLVLATGLFSCLLTAQTPRVAPAYSKAAPTALAADARPIDLITTIVIPRADLVAVAVEDRKRAVRDQPARYAIPHAMRVTPATAGTWETLGDGTRMWRLRITAAGATSLNLGFHGWFLPAKSRLLIYSVDGRHQIRPFTDADNADHKQLWTPIVPSEDIVVELTLPKRGPNNASFTLVHVGYGYRGFGSPAKTGKGSNKSGPCDIDVVCPQGVPWQDEINAVGLTSISGFLACTGFMVNNTATNQRPLFMTAAHCGLDAGSAPSLIVYWNHQASSCNGPRNGHFRDFQTGSKFLAANGPTDFTLVELGANPNPLWDVRYAGWDRSGSSTPGAVTIHHPSNEEKAISFENHRTWTTSYLGTSTPGDGTHVRVVDWDAGSTEPGSSGAPLFDLNHRVIGQLHGGDAACGNNLSDWYGRLSVSWNSGGSAATRLRDWLDPLSTGVITLDTLGDAMTVDPGGPILHSGSVGGPFTRPTTNYTLTNRSTSPIDYTVSVPGNSHVLLNGNTASITGTLAANGGRRSIQVALAPSVSALLPGRYVTDIDFRNDTSQISNRQRHVVEVGRMTVYSFDMNQDPGWTRTGQWAHGRPQGRGGVFHGFPDPSSGKTGSNVLGYNLNGDYTSNLPERHVTTNAIDCSGLSSVRVRFQRWLNVEESDYDHAYLRVSNNGLSWVTIWANSGPVVDSRWTEIDYDISHVADGQSRVFLRWTMGTTDSDWEYSGWNIDDVEIHAIPLGYFSKYGNGCATSTGQPILTASGFPTPGGWIDMQIAGGPPNGTGGLFLSLTPHVAGLACLHLLPPFVGPVLLPLNGSGVGGFSSQIPVSTPRNLHIYAQVITVQGSTFGSTNGLDILLK